jgi:hypothetical protein
LSDNRPPLLRGAALLAGDGRPLALDQARTAPQGSYRLALDVADAAPQNASFSPFDISLYLNGSEVQRYQFDALRARGGVLGLPTVLDRRNAPFWTADGRVDMGNYLVTSGTNVIGVVLRDFAQNRLERSWTVQVRQE